MHTLDHVNDNIMPEYGHSSPVLTFTHVFTIPFTLSEGQIMSQCAG